MKFLGKIEVTGLAPSFRDQLPLRVVGAFSASETHPVENAFAVGRNRDGSGAAQGSSIVDGERMASALSGGRNRNHERKNGCNHQIAHNVPPRTNQEGYISEGATNRNRICPCSRECWVKVWLLDPKLDTPKRKEQYLALY